jgi:hypothetical protein
VIPKKVQQERRSGFVRRIQTEPACNAGLERQAKTVFCPTREEMQMTPHKPQEAVRFDKRRLRERHGTPRCGRISPECALQVSQATGASLEVRLVLQTLHFARRTAMSA